jgi:hypothetical protein
MEVSHQLGIISFSHPFGLAFANQPFAHSLSQLYRHQMRLSNVVNVSRISSTVSFTKIAGK